MLNDVNPEEPLYLYRTSQVSLNLVSRQTDHMAGQYIFDKNRDVFTFVEARQFLSFYYRQAGWAHYEAGHRRDAFNLAFKAWRIYPLKGLKLLAKTIMSPIRVPITSS